MEKILTLFGTRPEIIKLTPVIRAVERCPHAFRGVTVASSQHTNLLQPFVRELGIGIDYDLEVMSPEQTPCSVLTRVIDALEPILKVERPDLVLVQGDTMTAIAGALAAFYSRIPIGHVEAGLRTGERYSPFPEEINRRIITQLADIHFAATENNVNTLLGEGIPKENIYLTGNPVVDTLESILKDSKPSQALAELLESVAGKRLIVLTTHRRENFGTVMSSHLGALRRFVKRHSEVELVFPVHPNPAVRKAVGIEFTGSERIHCIQPLEYTDFLHLLSRAWLIVSDSGGVQEEAPSLGKPILILRDTTERPEVIECGVGRLVGHSGDELEEMLQTACDEPAWFNRVRETENPFGRGDAGERIVAAIAQYLRVDSEQAGAGCTCFDETDSIPVPGPG